MHEPRKLNHGALVEVVAAEAGESTATVESVLRAAFDVIGRNVAAGFPVTVTNFGSWFSRTAPARSRRNPQTGETWESAPATYPRFRYSPAVKEATATGEVPATFRKRASR